MNEADTCGKYVVPKLQAGPFAPGSEGATAS